MTTQTFKEPAWVIDAGVGNLGNLVRALGHLGAEARITRDAQEIVAGRCLVLPGVGAFRPPRETLRGAMEEALAEALDGGAWLLGICVGYQLLFEAGREHGATDGLGLLPGAVEHLPAGEVGAGQAGARITLPHIGWNRLHDEADHPLLRDIAPHSFFYFVHSYAPLDITTDCALAQATHGVPFVAVGGRGRVLGTQFHPEKSGRAGLRLLGNFLQLANSET